MIMQIIAHWAIFGALLFVCTATPKLFKNKWWAIAAHGPLMWYVVFVAKVTGELKDKDQKDGCVKR